MSNRVVGSVISALITLVIFVGIPYMLPEYLPHDLVQMVADSGFDLAGFTNQIMVVGVITAALTLAKGFVNPTSVVSLLVSVAQNVSTLAFTIVLLGAGNIMSLGLTELTIETEMLTSIIKMDMRIFIYISFATVALKIVHAYLEWGEAKKEAAPPGRIAP